MNGIIFGIGLAIFVTYMYFLVKMINTQHKIQEKEHGKRQSAIVNRYYIAKGTGKIKKKKSTKV
jgi:MFS superfamily sulfate permease-like transporter|tara:strand:- start:385 stop:576 length:192 start_codon:yes stop_codon:yes gene_type:complete